MVDAPLDCLQSGVDRRGQLVVPCQTRTGAFEPASRLTLH